MYGNIKSSRDNSTRKEERVVTEGETGTEKPLWYYLIKLAFSTLGVAFFVLALIHISPTYFAIGLVMFTVRLLFNICLTIIFRYDDISLWTEENAIYWISKKNVDSIGDYTIVMKMLKEGIINEYAKVWECEDGSLAVVNRGLTKPEKCIAKRGYVGDWFRFEGDL